MALGISSLRILQEFENHIEPFVEKLQKFSKHSLKSEATSNPASEIETSQIGMLVGGLPQVE